MDQPARKPAPGGWRETQVLEQSGWLAGSAAYSGDGKVLFVGGTSGHVRAYAADTFKQVWEHKGGEHFAAIAADGKTLAVTTKDGVQFLDAASGKAGDFLDGKDSAPLVVSFFPDSAVLDEQGALVATKRQVIFGNARGYFVKSWLKWPLVSTITTSTVAAGREPPDAYAVPVAVAPDGKRVVVTGPIDRDTGKNVLWAWAAGSGEGNKLLEGHKAVVVAAAWSDKLIVTGDADGVVITWDAATFKEISRLSLGGRVAAVAVTADGQHTAAAVVGKPDVVKKDAYHEDIFVWPAANPPKKPEPISSHTYGGPFAGVASLTFSPDGKSLASGFANFTHLARLGELVGKVRVFTMAAEPPKREEKPGYVTDIQFSPDGKRFAVAPGVTVRDPDGKTLYTVPGEAAGFSADGTTLFVMGEKVLECDAETGKVRKEHPRSKTKLQWHLVAFAPDGKRYAAHFGFNVGVYETATGMESVQLDNQHEPGSNAIPATVGKQLVWSPDGKQMAAVGVLVDVGKLGAAGWDVATGKRFYYFPADFVDGPRAVAFSADSKAIAVAYKARVDLWTGGLNRAKNLGQHGLVSALAFSPDGKTLAAGIRLPIFHGADKPLRVQGHKTEVRLIDIATDKVVKVFDGFEGVNHMATKLPVTALAFSPDGKRIIAGTGILPIEAIPKDAPKSGEFKMWDLTNAPAKLVPAPVAAALDEWKDKSVLTHHAGPVDSVAFAPDGKAFVSGGADGKVLLWDAATLQPRELGSVSPPGKFTAVAFSPDGTLVAATRDKVTGFFDPEKRQTVQMRPVFPGGRGVAFSPDGKWVATSDGSTTGFRGLSGGGEAYGTVPGTLEGQIPAPVAWSADSLYLAGIMPIGDGNWRVSITGVTPETKPRDLDGHKSKVHAVAWSKDGKLIASGGEDGTVILWDGESFQELRRGKIVGRDGGLTRFHGLTFSPDGKTLAAAVTLGSGKSADRVILIDGDTVESGGNLFPPAAYPVRTLAFSPNGKLLIAACGIDRSKLKPLMTPEEMKAAGAVVVWERKP